MNNLIIRVIATLCVASALLLPAVASAAPVFDQYGNPVAGVIDGPNADTDGPNADTDGPNADTAGPNADTGKTLAATADADTVGSLPLTGSELSFLMLAGVAVIGSGAILRRVGFSASARRRRNGDA